MSNIKITDRRGGKYQAIIEFTYGECERLPFNLLRRIGAKIKTTPNAGIVAAADFNIRVPAESNLFLEILDMFGEDGSYIHGSAADAEALALKEPPQGGAAFGDDDLEIEGSL